MADTKKKYSKTERILVGYHLLKRCREVSCKEVTDVFHVSAKTVRRDLHILAQAGYAANYSRERKGYVIDRTPRKAEFPERRNERMYLRKIIRLTTLMNEMDQAADPVEWYHAKYPDLSARTMQRDFKTLNKIGYSVRRYYEEEDDDYSSKLSRPGKYCCEWSWLDAYSLDVFF